MPIEPDTKDWTWVLEKRCDECGFDAGAFSLEDLVEMIRTNAAGWRALLNDPRAKRRPSDDRWSGVEYACHVRDVFRLYDERLEMMLEQDGPHYPNWDQDEAAIARGYANQDPSTVASELEQAGATIAQRFDSVQGPQWQRTGFRSDGARFTIESFARYFIHDPIHHVHDVTQGYERIG